MYQHWFIVTNVSHKCKMLIIRETICGMQKDGNAVISGQLLSIPKISLKQTST